MSVATPYAAALYEAATEADGLRPVDEHVLLHLRVGGDTESTHLLAWQGDLLVGYAHLDATDEVEGPIAEIVVHPEARRLGVGRLLVQSVVSRDYGLIMGAALLFAAAIAVANLVVDVLYAVIDPRVRNPR